MKRTLLIVYLAMGVVICGWFTVAVAFAWRAPDFGVVKSLNSGGGGYGGRSYGGSWGGGK
jgi:hypothetical protein